MKQQTPVAERPDAAEAAPVDSAWVERGTRYGRGGVGASFLRLALEVSLIVLGVLLALGVDQWQADREEAARVELALEGIRSELEANLNEVRRALTYHTALAGTMARLLAAGAPLTPDAFPGGLVNPGQTFSTAWQSAQSTGAAVDMRYHVVLALSRVYQEQQFYERLSDLSVDLIFGDIYRNGVESVLDRYAYVRPLVEEFAKREERLARAYERVLEQLEDPSLGR